MSVLSFCPLLLSFRGLPKNLFGSFTSFRRHSHIVIPRLAEESFRILHFVQDDTAVLSF